jgi:hypothetical protein
MIDVSDSPKTFGVVAQLKQSANQQIIPKKLIIFLLFFERSDLVVNLSVKVARKIDSSVDLKKRSWIVIKQSNFFSFFLFTLTVSFFFQNGTARKFDFVAFASDTFDHNLLTFFQFVANVFDTSFGNFGNMQ